MPRPTLLSSVLEFAGLYVIMDALLTKPVSLNKFHSFGYVGSTGLIPYCSPDDEEARREHKCAMQSYAMFIPTLKR